MNFSAFPNLATILAICASLAAALPLETGGNTIRTAASIGSNGCSLDKIRECIDDTGLESTICFAQVCAGKRVISKMTKRQDQCTEENLLQCAVAEWRDPEICFQELCL